MVAQARAVALFLDVIDNICKSTKELKISHYNKWNIWRKLEKENYEWKLKVETNKLSTGSNR